MFSAFVIVKLRKQQKISIYIYVCVCFEQKYIANIEFLVSPRCRAIETHFFKSTRQQKYPLRLLLIPILELLYMSFDYWLYPPLMPQHILSAHLDSTTT